MELSKFSNGDKKAIVLRESFSYTVKYYLKNKVIKKDIISDYAKAESLAEEYVICEDNQGPTLLTENA